MTACAILLGLVAIMKFTPDIAMARWLSGWCVEKPAAMLNRLGRGQLIGGMALILLICVLIHAEAGEAGAGRVGAVSAYSRVRPTG